MPSVSHRSDVRPKLPDVDVDAFLAAHSGEWARLEVLARRRRLTGAEADELVALYRRTATHLSLIQSRAHDPAIVARLSGLLARSRGAAVAGGPVSGWSALGRALWTDFPVAVYRAWRWWVSVAAASVALAAIMMLYVRDHPEKLRLLLSDDRIRQLVDHDFANYYSEHPAQSFAAQVWTNNALVTAFCLFLGVTVIGPLYLMFTNVLNLGITGGAMLGAGKAGVFFGLILPHGLLELTCVFIAGGVGLKTGWSWIAPGELPRARALAEAGRISGVVAIGVAAVLIVAGALEAFVTPSGLPTWTRIGIGALAELVFLGYIAILGRRGVTAGATGDLRFGEREDVAPVA
ncbi:MAG: hypothetical protein QOE71_4228 [Pseudonocardiales bacterium]|nr:hypothetical protein [Pseudonocardiales bacterium]